MKPYNNYKEIWKRMKDILMEDMEELWGQERCAESELVAEYYNEMDDLERMIIFDE